MKGYLGILNFSIRKLDCYFSIDYNDYGNPNVAKVGGLQSQGAKGEAVVIYCEPFATRDLKLSGFPEG